MSKTCTHVLSQLNEPTPWYVRTCAYGNCSIEVCAIDNIIMGAFGPWGCPCDHTPGWKAAYVEQMGKPHPPVKAAGRHKGRVQRAKRRHDLRAHLAFVEGLNQMWDADVAKLQPRDSGSGFIFDDVARDLGITDLTDLELETSHAS